jgi:hypothetical protein
VAPVSQHRHIETMEGNDGIHLSEITNESSCVLVTAVLVIRISAVVFSLPPAPVVSAPSPVERVVLEYSLKNFGWGGLVLIVRTLEELQTFHSAVGV